MSSAKLGVEAVKAISLLAAPVVDKAVAALGSQPIKAAERLAVEQASLIFASTVFRAAQAAASTVPRTEKQDQPSQNVEVKNPVPGRAADLGSSSHGATRKQGSSSTTGQVNAKVKGLGAFAPRITRCDSSVALISMLQDGCRAAIVPDAMESFLRTYSDCRFYRFSDVTFSGQFGLVTPWGKLNRLPGEIVRVRCCFSTAY